MEPSDLHESALRRLPEEIASVQSHLQRLDDGVREAAHRLRSSEEGVKASQDQQRALQDGVETALQAIAVLETQKGDLQALAAVKQQHAENAHRRAEELQARSTTVRLQFKHASTSFAALCSKFQHRYDTQSMHQVSADHELLASQLQQQLLTAQGISKEKQQKLELLSLITRASKDDTAKLCATHSNQESLLKVEQDSSHKLNLATRQASFPAAVTQATKLLQAIRTESQDIKISMAARQQELLDMQKANVLARQQNANMEQELKQLQAALQALGGPAADEQQSMFMPATQNHLQHSDTGVFGSSNNRNKQQAVHREVQCQAQSTDHHLGPNSSFQSNCTATAPAGAQVPSCAAHSQVFQYPEDPTSPPDSHRFTALHERTSVTAARHDAQQHLHTHPPDWNRNLQTHQHGQQKASNQVAQYTVQEPDSPCHTSSLHNPSRNLQPAAAVMHTGSSARRTGSNSVDGSDLPAGCLYQDTTIRRTTTPVKNGKRSTAWAHEEFVTVRQIREIKRSEAHNMSWLQRGEPHTTQGVEVEEYHRDGKRRHVQAVRQQHGAGLQGHTIHQNLQTDFSAPDASFTEHDSWPHSSREFEGHPTPTSSPEPMLDTFSAYNQEPPTGQNTLLAARGRSVTTSNGSKRGQPASRGSKRQGNKPRKMKRLIPDEQPALDTDEEEQAARYESYRLEDERDAELKVDIGMGGMSRR